jgi:hypothetical protein
MFIQLFVTNFVVIMILTGIGSVIYKMAGKSQK